MCDVQPPNVSVAIKMPHVVAHRVLSQYDNFAKLWHSEYVVRLSSLCWRKRKFSGPKRKIEKNVFWGLSSLSSSQGVGRDQFCPIFGFFSPSATATFVGRILRKVMGLKFWLANCRENKSYSNPGHFDALTFVATCVRMN